MGTYGAKGIWHSGSDEFTETFPWLAIDLVSPQKLRQNKYAPHFISKHLVEIEIYRSAYTDL